ncbi:hypothetical protein C7S18_23530 (plasmid) [Ahniella affigens]|uniref:Uncharacterized protein n=2 Tax=Ahniella affigens TaxID=2021234 RepID=A0A2P1PZK3_9GAMM|nr:hypothetical protein C7S18_23530 [Ahniella affigens]
MGAHGAPSWNWVATGLLALIRSAQGGADAHTDIPFLRTIRLEHAPTVTASAGRNRVRWRAYNAAACDVGRLCTQVEQQRDDGRYRPLHFIGPVEPRQGLRIASRIGVSPLRDGGRVLAPVGK